MENEKRPARPWDLFNKNIGRVEKEIASERFKICMECPKFLPTGQCKECGCFMLAKVKLPNASCPDHKWEEVEVMYKEVKTTLIEELEGEKNNG